MLGSSSSYFHKTRAQLNASRLSLIQFLELWMYSQEQIDIYLKAFDHFSCYPDQFDGATIVKDLQSIPGLDINAMLHDFHYIEYNAGAGFISKYIADLIFAKEMERLGKGGSAWIRFAGLTLSSVGFTPIARLKRGKPNLKALQKDKEILLGL